MKRNALFVGVDQYADGQIPNLSCAVNDATDLHGFFKFGAGYDQVALLQNPAGKKEVLDGVRDLTADLGPGDFFLFFFAGHGFRVGENHVLVCSKDLYDDVKYEDDGLPLGQLKRRLSGPFDRAILLDACQSDILATRGGEGIAERDLSLILDAPAAPAGDGALAIMTSCDAGQTAGELSEERHGLFTRALLDLLQEGRRNRRRLDLSDAFRIELGRRMREIAARAGLSTEQRPRLSATGLANPVLLDGDPDAAKPAPEPSASPARPSARAAEPASAPSSARSAERGGPSPARLLEIARECDARIGRTLGVRQFWSGDAIPPNVLSTFCNAFSKKLGLGAFGTTGRAVALWNGAGFPAPAGAFGFLVAEDGIRALGGTGAATAAGFLDWRTFGGPEGCVEPVSSTEIRLCRSPEIRVQFVASPASRNVVLRMFEALREAAEDGTAAGRSRPGAAAAAPAAGPQGAKGMFLGCLVWIVVCLAIGIVVGALLR